MEAQFSLSWDAHKKNICCGLSHLQQNGEFVDMTLAADGHFVKVHQLVMVLASPYIKQLITTADCKHPVIFLNKISYKTLNAILQYIYTGEVLVNVDDLHKLVEAASALHIKGLEGMNLQQLTGASKSETREDSPENENERTICEELHERSHSDEQDDEVERMDDNECKVTNDSQEDESRIINDGQDASLDNELTVTFNQVTPKRKSKEKEQNKNVIQYTLSNRGSLQMILNRFVYYLKHSNRNNTRQWRCVDYLSHHIKCPALVVTKGDAVIKRASAHTHSFHDKQILKKVQSGAVFAAIHELDGYHKKNKRPQRKASIEDDGDVEVN